MVLYFRGCLPVPAFHLLQANPGGGGREIPGKNFVKTVKIQNLVAKCCKIRKK